jgi:SAM-dependent methyltransferase
MSVRSGIVCIANGCFIVVLRTLARRVLPRPVRHAVHLSLAYVTALLPSQLYWPVRYRLGGISGPGSLGRMAEFKARVLNTFVAENGIRSVIEFGCGNGDQLSLAKYPAYRGFDISNAALERCRARFSDDDTKTFRHLSEYRDDAADLALSLDVIFHLVEDAVYERHMRLLFQSATRFVIIYSSDYELPEWRYQIRHRKHSAWVAANRGNWHLAKVIPNQFSHVEGRSDTSFCNFYIYSR